MEAIKDTFTKSKKKKVKAVHQKVKVFRVHDPKMAVLMWGVTHSVSQLSHVPQQVMLLKDDFKAYSKIKIDNHFYNKEHMPGHFKFKEYMPLVFRNLRERFAIDEKLYAASFLIQPQLSKAQGNSGAKFLLTTDKRFYIKTLQSVEVEMMHHIMPSYHRYIVESHSDTLLPQYLGMYRTTLDNKEYYYLVVRSVFSCKKKVQKKYDLKGSRIDREAKDSEKDKESVTFKDNDFTKENARIFIGAEQKEKFKDRLTKDVNFLSGLNIMDYSLLVGIHDTEHVDSSEPEDEQDGEGPDGGTTGDESGDGLEEPASPTTDGETSAATPETLAARRQRYSRTESVSSSDGYESEYFALPSSDESLHSVYYMGIIDVLTYYGATKKAAHAAKTVKHGAGAEISTVKPHLYATRFLEFMDSVME
ncbi:phosphatidylinositol 5-phosphate 4-kinase type-2 alpha-like isoform X2 [Clytia hemisphaerica]|uniref:1-phosphatidylinositol-5-phosphate 4-kinase n=1 Tax=Clytia hemisphaerica TaxID=252671 RepID=A0A7M6DME6_9CNID|eukprot:TCONS_00000595-protein